MQIDYSENIRAAAANYLRRGFCLVPTAGKRPKDKSWQKLRLTEADLASAFCSGDNLGVHLGAASGGVVDVDLDAPEARALAASFLPATGWKHGRASSPMSHYWYVAHGAQYLKLEDPDPRGSAACLVELRQDGHQTVVPPSIHPCGERYEWECEGDMGEVDARSLERAVRRLGAAALLARHWPAKGSRDTAALALSGVLARAGWDEPSSDHFVTTVAWAAGDEEYADRAKATRCAARLREGKNTYGWPKFVEVFGERVAGKISEWLELSTELTAASEDVLTDVPDQVAALNDEWCVLDESGKMFVCRFATDVFPNGQSRRRLVRYSFPDFKRKHENVRIGGETLGEAWLAWPGRRQYDRAVFDPTAATNDPAVLNLWRGWAIEPAPGDWSLIRRHIVEVVCGGNASCAEYLIKWMARLFQRPNELGFVVPVLRGKEGVGKSVLGYAIRRVLGQYGLAVSNPHHVVGNFNAHLRDLLFLEASEAFFAGDRAQANQLKALITDDMLVIEAKGVDAINVPNMLHVFMTTNESWAIQAGPESRRYFVLDVSDVRRGDADYFKALFAQVKDDRAIAGMLHDLLAMDLSEFNVRGFPVTDALLDQRERSLTGVLAWALDVADRGRLESTAGAVPWRPFFSTHELFEDFRWWSSRNRYERGMSRESFGRALKAELCLEAKRECPRALADGLPLDARGKPGYMVDTVEAFCARARRAAGLEVQGSAVQGSGFTRDNPEPANEPLERVVQGSQGLQGRVEGVAAGETLVLPLRVVAGGGS
jgi:hypothetical protein